MRFALRFFEGACDYAGAAQERVQPIAGFSVFRRHEDQAVRPIRQKIKRIVDAARIGNAVTIGDEITLAFRGSQSYKAQVRVLYIASFARRASKLPWPNRLQSEITTAFLATRNISFTTTSGRCTWCRIENSQTTSKLASAKGSARPVPRISVPEV